MSQIIELTEQQFDKLNELRIELTAKYPITEYTVSPKDISNEEVIYIHQSCNKLKKLELREWLKSKGIKQTFDPSKATMMVVKNKMIGYNHSSFIKISTSNYSINWEGNDYYWDTYEFDKLTYNKEYQIYVKEVGAPLRKTIPFSCRIRNQNIPNCLDDILRINKFVDQEELQIELYKWQLTVEKYEDPTDYNWDAIEQLLKSDTYKVAVNILKNKNLELYKEDLIMFIIDNFYKLIKIPDWMSFVRRHLFSKDIILEKALHKAYLFNRGIDINYLLNRLRTNDNVKLNMDKILTKYDYDKDSNRFIHKSVNSLASV